MNEDENKHNLWSFLHLHFWQAQKLARFWGGEMLWKGCSIGRKMHWMKCMWGKEFAKFVEVRFSCQRFRRWYVFDRWKYLASFGCRVYAFREHPMTCNHMSKTFWQYGVYRVTSGDALRIVICVATLHYYSPIIKVSLLSILWTANCQQKRESMLIAHFKYKKKKKKKK